MFDILKYLFFTVFVYLLKYFFKKVLSLSVSLGEKNNETMIKSKVKIIQNFSSEGKLFIFDFLFP